LVNRDSLNNNVDEVPPIDGRSIGRVLAILRREAPRWNAPVLGLIATQESDPFLVLVGCILSLRTKDETTAKAAARLFARARTAQAMLELEQGEIEHLIYPVGFYRVKARQLRALCRVLIERFEGRVPDTIEGLLSLTGVGRKTANLVLSEAYGKPALCVDTHVHRISNRWGLVSTSKPAQTEQALKARLPRRYWAGYNGLLVAFGQTICRPVSPLCSRCPLNRFCPKRGVTHRR
jgi:endonuclease-3